MKKSLSFYLIFSLIFFLSFSLVEAQTQNPFQFTAQFQKIIEQLQALIKQLQEIQETQKPTPPSKPSFPTPPLTSTPPLFTPPQPLTPSSLLPSLPSKGKIILEELPGSPEIPCSLPPLSINSRNNSVYLLQMILNKSGYYPEGLITGYYGRLTKGAVERFQKAQGLPVTGQIDEKTSQALNNLVRKYYPEECGREMVYEYEDEYKNWVTYVSEAGFRFSVPQDWKVKKDSPFTYFVSNSNKILSEANPRQAGLDLKEWMLEVNLIEEKEAKKLYDHPNKEKLGKTKSGEEIYRVYMGVVPSGILYIITPDYFSGKLIKISGGDFIYPEEEINKFLRSFSLVTTSGSQKAPYINYVVPQKGGSNDWITIYGKNLFDTIPSGIKIEFWRKGQFSGGLFKPIEVVPDGSSLKFLLSGLLTENTEPGIYQLRVSNDYGESNFVDFEIVSFEPVKEPEQKISPKLKIEIISGLRDSYNPNEKILIELKGIEEYDNSLATPEEGFNVQAYIFDSLRTKTYEGVNGVYDFSNRKWTVSLTVPSDLTKEYDLRIYLYCARDNASCRKIYSPTDIGGIFTHRFKLISSSVEEKNL